MKIKSKWRNLKVGDKLIFTQQTKSFLKQENFLNYLNIPEPFEIIKINFYSENKQIDIRFKNPLFPDEFYSINMETGIEIDTENNYPFFEIVELKEN